MAPKVAYSLAEAAAWGFRDTALTLGVFDGVHRGHRQILEALIAQRDDGSAGHAVALTFNPHPATVTGARDIPAILSTIEERVTLLAEFDLDGIYVVPFNDTTRNTTYEDYIEKVFRESLGMTSLVLGYDLHFGHRRQGSPERVQAYGATNGFAVNIVEPVAVEGDVVSSTQIRDALAAGNLERANRMLGHPYLVGGEVVRGAQRGRTIGFPTANVNISDPFKLWPPLGVYAVRVDWRGNRHDGMMNVGVAPTVAKGKREVEVHIFDLEADLYGERLDVWCHAYLRDERKFQSLEELKAQLELDRVGAREALSRPGVR